MTETQSAGSSVCPWCSAEVPAGRHTCPACGANLVEAGESTVPGLTAIDPAAVLRNVRTTGAAPRRSRILSLITGEEPDDLGATTGSPAALAPPPPDVRREMLRMEIAAEISNLTAEADSIAADEAVDATAGDPSLDLVPPESGAASADEGQAEPVAVDGSDTAAPATTPLGDGAAGGSPPA
jgi:hypothetical protein